MASFSINFPLSPIFFLLFCLFVFASADLSATFYSSSCPKALSTVKTAVKAAVAKEKRMGASLLRLHFHDCFVNGCDASVLLDDTSDLKGEKTAVPNDNSLRGFEVIDNIKSQIESICPNVVSCADILAIAARDAVFALGGPAWIVKLGRRDSTTASLSAANNDIPDPTASLSSLISTFSKKGLSVQEMVALSGAHTIGQARCTSFRARIHNDSSIIDADFAGSLKSNCPRSSGSSDGNLSPLDSTSSTVFDSAYYTNLMLERGLLHSDQQLYSGGSADSQVEIYADSLPTFFSHFADAMVKMGNISPLTGSNGQIRVNCRKINS